MKNSYSHNMDEIKIGKIKEFLPIFYMYLKNIIIKDFYCEKSYKKLCITNSKYVSRDIFLYEILKIYSVRLERLM